MSMVFRLAFAAILCMSLCLAQTVAKVKPGSSAYKAIVLVAKAEFQKSAAFPLKTPSGTVRRAGNWAFVHDALAFVNPKHIGDGEGMALLRLRNGKWKIVEATVGSGGMEDLAADWRKKFKLPKGLVG